MKKAAGIVECFVKLDDIRKCSTVNGKTSTNPKPNRIQLNRIQPDRIRSLAPWLPRQPELTRSNLLQNNTTPMQTFLNEIVQKSK